MSRLLLFMVVLVAIIGGRVLPIFTRNAMKGLRVRSAGRWRDKASLASLVALGVLALIPATPGLLFATVAMFGAVAHGLRMLGWGGSKTLNRPILWVLHTAYFFLPVGLALWAARGFGAPVPFWVPLHVLAVGVLGVMTLGMMTRVSLGHTGRPLAANRATTLAYALLIAAVIVRSAGPFLGATSWQIVMLTAVGLWTAAFAIFVLGYARFLISPRADGKSG